MSKPTSPRGGWWFRSRSRCRRTPGSTLSRPRQNRIPPSWRPSVPGSRRRCRIKPERLRLYRPRVARFRLVRPHSRGTLGQGERRPAMSDAATTQPPQIKSRLGAILRSTSGNFLEQFDFFLFGFYASAISKAFFPPGNETTALLLTFTTFWLGALMRPVGAIVLGAYIDRIGRRQGLIVTLAIMAAGTVVIAFCPTYATIGVAAPIIVLLGRLLQGFSAGVELGGVSVYLSEIATPGNKGFYTSWQSGSQQVAVVFAAPLGVLLNKFIAGPQMTAWGWRIPLLVGCAIIPFVFLIRRSLAETDDFLKRKHHPMPMQIFRSTMS